MVKPDVANRQIEAERAAPGESSGAGAPGQPGQGGEPQPGGESPAATVTRPKRFHGSAALDPTRVGRDAGRIAEEVISHLAGLVGATVTVTIEIEAKIPDGAPDNVVRTVTENSRTLKFTDHGFERE